MAAINIHAELPRVAEKDIRMARGSKSVSKYESRSESRYEE